MISEAVHMDNMEYMAKFPDKFFELAVVDPPYGINAPNMQMGTNLNRKGKGQYPGESTASKLKGRLNQCSGKLKNRLLNKSTFSWDDRKPSPNFFKELFRVSKNQIIWRGNYFTDNLPESRCWICWDKLQPWDNFSQFELAWTSFDRPTAMFRYSNTGGANKETKIHPTQKPIALYKWILKTFANQGWKILDTHLGSGSSRIAAYEMEFDFYGCNIDLEYLKLHEKRIHPYTQINKLFTYNQQTL